MRAIVLDLLRHLPYMPEPIYDFGALRVAGQRSRPTVADCLGQPVIGCDMQAGPGVDCIEDLHALTLPSESVGTALLFDTIEHVSRPWLALEEVHRVLRPEGIVLMTSHLYFPIHAYPEDYWRFTPSGLRVLLTPFATAYTESAGLQALPHTVIGVASKGVETVLYSTLVMVVAEWALHRATSWRERGLAFLPPCLLGPLYSGLTRVLRFHES